MNINKEQIDNLTIVVSLQIGTDDYEPKVNEILRDYRRKANMPGFRPGKVPEGLIRKMYGKAVLIDEINKLVSESLQNYMKEQELMTLGDPMPKTSGDDMDWEIGNDFTFDFEMGLAPEINLNLSKEDRITKYQMMVGRELIDKDIESHASRHGQFLNVDAVVDFKEKLTGDIVQLGEDGQPLDDGLTAEDASMLVGLIKDEEHKEPFKNAKVGDEIVFNLSKTFPNDWEISSILKKKDKNEVGNISDSLFRFTVKTIQKHFNAELNQELYDEVFGKDSVTNIDEFENRIKENIEQDFEETCQSKFSLDMREYLLKKIDPKLPEEFLRKWLLAANKDVSEEVFEKEFPQFLENTKWEMIANAIIKQYELKVDEQEVIDTAKATTRRQYNMYGLKNVADEYLTQHAMRMLKDEKSVRAMASQAMERKIAQKVSEIVNMDIQEISPDDFQKLIYAANDEEIEQVEEAGEIEKVEEVGKVEAEEAGKAEEIGEEIVKIKGTKKRSKKKKEVEAEETV